MGSLEKKEPAPAQATTIDNAIMQVIRDSTIEPERLEKFLDLQIKMQDREAQRQLSEALAGFQGDCPQIKKTSDGHNTKYAKLDEIDYIIRPVLKSHGLSYSFDVKPNDEVTNILITTIRHQSGASIDSSHIFPRYDKSGNKNEAQAIKSALSYAKRAGLENALGIVTVDEDDDAKRAVDTPATQDQIDAIQSLASILKVDEKKMFAMVKVKGYSELSRLEADKLLSALKLKKAKGGK